MDISKKTLDELKVLAYDEIRKAEIASKNLQTISAAIAAKESGESVERE